MKELKKQDPAIEWTLPPSDQREIGTCTLKINPRDISLKRGIGVIGAERHFVNTQGGISHAMLAHRSTKTSTALFSPSELTTLKENFWLPTGAIEIPKQLIVGGIAGLAIGAVCEVSGKYLDEGIGYLCGGSKGAAQGELIGEDIGAVMGMILPFVILI